MSAAMAVTATAPTPTQRWNTRKRIAENNTNLPQTMILWFWNIAAWKGTMRTHIDQKFSEQPIKQTFVYFYGGYCAENVQFKGKKPPLQNSTCTVTDKILEITWINTGRRRSKNQPCYVEHFKTNWIVLKKPGAGQKPKFCDAYFWTFHFLGSWSSKPRDLWCICIVLEPNLISKIHFWDPGLQNISKTAVDSGPRNFNLIFFN